MDQVKEFLRQVVKYRFWISVVIATLFAGGAYVLGSGPIQKKTTEETTKITSAAKDVQQYSSPSTPTPAYKPIVEEKTAVLTQDVDAAWKELYNRQAPLLTWPKSVESRFKKWGRQWPAELAAASAVETAIVDYTEAYPGYVADVYKTFRPFDYTTGEGVVAAPPSDALLRPAVFDLNKQRPKLGEVWSAQERLWAQRTVLDVVNQVNRNATDWESAYLKEIKALEVGNESAQDQRSVAKGDTLEPPAAITAPDEPEEEVDAGGGGMMGGMGGGMGGGGMSGYAGMMRGMMGGGGPGGAARGPEEVKFLTPAEGESSDKYQILPIMLSVLIDENHVQNLLVELSNSPMAIEVMEVELRRPESRVTKPVKGESPMGYGGMMGGYGGMMARGMMGRGGGMMGYGGMSSMMTSMMGRRGMGGGEMTGMMMGGPGMMGGMGGMGGAAVEKKGTDQRNVDRAKEREEAEKAIEQIKGSDAFDRYFNIIELTVYGQARFYNKPTEETAAPESPGDAAPAETSKAAPAEAPKS